MPQEPNIVLTDYVLHHKKKETRPLDYRDRDMGKWDLETITESVDVDSECEGYDRNDGVLPVRFQRKEHPNAILQKNQAN